jgi:hypothetical protein
MPDCVYRAVAREFDPGLLRFCRSLLSGAGLGERFEDIYRRRRWVPAWRDALFAQPHFHANTPEALGFAFGVGCVRFGLGTGKDLVLCLAMRLSCRPGCHTTSCGLPGTSWRSQPIPTWFVTRKSCAPPKMGRSLAAHRCRPQVRLDRRNHLDGSGPMALSPGLYGGLRWPGSCDL